MTQEKIIVENEGQKIVGIMHVPEKPKNKAVILAHGFTGTKDREGSSDSYYLLGEALSKRGFHTLRFDFRGTGESEGLFEDMTLTGGTSDLKHIISYLKERFEKIGVVGSSLGASITMLSYEHNMDCIVLWYPALFLKETDAYPTLKSHEKELNEKGKFLYKISEPDKTKYYVGKKLLEEWENVDLFSKVKEVTVPILFIHGDKDKSVQLDQAQRGFEAAKEPKRLEIFKGSDHCWKDENDKVVDEWKNKAVSLTVEWFEKWL